MKQIAIVLLAASALAACSTGKDEYRISGSVSGMDTGIGFSSEGVSEKLGYLNAGIHLNSIPQIL